MNNSIALRISDFLKEFPPFHLLQKEELLHLSEEVWVHYFEKDTTIFHSGQASEPNFYIVHQGAVGLYTKADNQHLLVTICDEGDLFGLRPILSNDPYKLEARTTEESIVYAIPATIITNLMDQNEALSSFIQATFRINQIDDESNSNSSLHKFQNWQSHISQQKIQFSKNPLITTASHTIQNAAEQMVQRRVGSIIIHENNKPIGIITDKDFRSKVATGLISIDATVSLLMSSPVVCALSDISHSEAQMLMMQQGISHLCITEDGTPDSKLIGVFSEHDIAFMQGNNPHTLLKRITKAKDIKSLENCRIAMSSQIKNLINQEASIEFITDVAGNLTQKITERAIELAIEKMEKPPPVSFCWISLGSQARREQLVPTDQDNALLFEDVPEVDYATIQEYFLKLSNHVNTNLNAIGYEFCPAQVMARNERWCLSLSQWKEQFQKWIQSPDEEAVMHCSIFFDMQPVYGNNDLFQSLTQFISEGVGKYEIFLNFLARNAVLNPPPLGFFRQFILEKDLENKDEFDLKARALMPFIDAARVLSLEKEHLLPCSTLKRFEFLIEAETQNKRLFQACYEAFELLLQFRAQQAIKDGDSGRYIDVKQMTKMEQLQLRTCFKPLKDIQELLKVRFKLSQLL